jgi:hypothetical protein
VLERAGGSRDLKGRTEDCSVEFLRGNFGSLPGS